MDFFSKVILRTPTNSLEDLYKYLEIEDDKLFETAFSDKKLLNSIKVASPSFYEQLLNYDNLNDEKKIRNLKITLLNFIVRSSIRCIPFGMFSGAGLLDFNKKTTGSSVILKKAKHNVFTFDSNFIMFVSNVLLSNSSVIEKIKFYSNNTIYRSNDYFRFFENDGDSTILSQIKWNSLLDQILKECQGGLYLKQIEAILIPIGYEIDEVRSFVSNLIASKVLISSLEIGGLHCKEQGILKELLNDKNHKFEEVNDFEGLFDSFLNLNGKLELSYLREDGDNFLKENEKEIECIETYFKPIFNVHSYFDFEGGLGEKRIKQLKKAIEVLTTINNCYSINQNRLDLFKDRFFERYGYNPVRLVSIFDIDTDFGYDNSSNSAEGLENALLKKFPHNKKSNKNKIEWETLDAYLYKRIVDFTKGNDETIVLGKKDFDFFKKNAKNQTNLSKTGCARFSIYGDHLYMNSISYGSPSKIISRFSQTNESFESYTNDIREYEKSLWGENVILAEIDYLPTVSFGNTMKRKLRVKNIIPILGSPERDAEQQEIKIADLYLKYKDDKLVLFSKSLKKEIIPSYTAPLNEDHPNVLPIFKLLFDLSLQYENYSNGIFNVEKYHQFFKHIPRFTHDEIILSSASWILSEKDFNFSDKSDVMNAFSQARKTIGFPEKFVFSDNDIEMFVDSSNLLLIESFLIELKKRGKLIIKEFLPEKLSSIVVNDKNEIFNNDFFLPLKFGYEKFSKKNDDFTINNKVISKFGILSEWLYVKIYVVAFHQNTILEELNRTLERLLRNNEIKKYFFIRYSDQDGHHIRLRINLLEVEKYYVVLKQINDCLDGYFKKGTVSKILLDNYEREIERYGKDKIVHFEDIFFKESRLVMKLLKSTPKEYLWLNVFAFYEIYANFFALTLEEKILFSAGMKKSFEIEFNTNKHINKFINEKYTLYKEKLFKVYEDSKSLSNKKEYLLLHTTIKSLNGKEQILSNDKRKYYLNNLIHMCVVRLLGVKNNRLYEYVLYNFYNKMLNELYHRGK